MKYHVLHDFITSTPFEEKSSDHLHKMELLTNFDVSLRSFLAGVYELTLSHLGDLIHSQPGGGGGFRPPP